MKRPLFIAATCATALRNVVAVRGQSRAAQFVYKLASADPVEYPTTVQFARMATSIKEESNGRLEIAVYPNSVLGSQTSMMAQLRLGSIQLLNIAHSLYASVAPVAQISSLGFAFSSEKQALDTMDNALGTYIRKELASKGIVVFEKTLVNGFRQMTSSTKPIRRADDLAGFKVRVQPAPIYVDMFKSLSASPVPIDGNELYTALQTHVVDGQENTFPIIELFKVYEVQKYLSITNHSWGGSWLGTNADAVERLATRSTRHFQPQRRTFTRSVPSGRT